MKNILKTVYHKKFFTIIILSVLFLFTLISIQIQVTTSSKHETLVDRVDAVNGAHTIVFLGNPKKIDQAIAIASKYGDVKLTTAFPYVLDSYHFYENAPKHQIILEGYTDDGTDQYRVIQGKALNELSDYEVAVTESYARKLSKDGIDPMGYVIDFSYLNQFYDEQYYNGAESPTDNNMLFRIVSVIDYPNFNDLSIDDDTLEKIPLFSRPMQSMGLVNQKTMESVKEYVMGYGQNELVYSFTRNEYRDVMKVHFDDYSVKKEKDLEAELLNLNGIYFDAAISVYTLNSLSRFVSAEDILFEQVSIYVVGGLILSTAYSFYIFLRRQLISNAQTIGTLGLLGIQQKRLILSYMSQIFLVALLALGLWGGMNVYLQQIFLSNRSLASLIDCNTPILLGMLPLFMGYVLIIVVVYYAQLKRYLRNAFLMSKSADKKYLNLPAIQHKGYALTLSIKSMLSSMSFSLSVMLNIGIIIVTLLVSMSFYSNVSTIYNEETFGIKFDHIVLNAEVEQYDKTKEFTSNQVVVGKVSDMNFVDVLYSEQRRVFYRSNILLFYDYMAPFVPLIEGSDVTKEDFENLEEQTFYVRYAHATRRHFDLRNLMIYDVNKISGKGTAEKMYLFYLQSQFEANSETAAEVKGKVNSLIDNGWIAYIQVPNSVNKFTFPRIDSYFVQVDQENEQAFLDYTKSQGLETISFKEVANIFQENNNRVTKASLQIMVSVSVLLILILVINQSVALMSNMEENKKEHQILKEIGVSSRIIKRKLWIQELLTIALGLIIAAIFYFIIYPFAKDGLLKAYGLFSTIALPSVYYMTYGIIIAGLLIIITGLSLYKIKK